MALQFENRYQAIAYYKKQRSLVDDDLQSWLVHFEAEKAKKIAESMKLLRHFNDLIDWNQSELKKEARHNLLSGQVKDSPFDSETLLPSAVDLPLTSFSREPASCAGSLGLNSSDKEKTIGGDEING